MVFSKMMDTAKTLAAAAVETASSVGTMAADTVMQTAAVLSPLLQQAADNVTSVPVTFYCVPTGNRPDDYEIKVGYKRFARLLEEGAFVQPKIVVKATSSTLNRDVLAARMEAALISILAGYDAELTDAKRQAAKSLLQTLVTSGFSPLAVGADVFTKLFMLTLTGSGVKVGPQLWLLVGLDGVMALAARPKLFWLGTNTMMGGYLNMLGDTEHEVDQARTEVRRLVSTLNIIIDPELK